MVRHVLTFLLSAYAILVNKIVAGRYCGKIVLDSTYDNANSFADCTTARSVHIMNTKLTSLEHLFPSLGKIKQTEDDSAVVIAYNENLIWSGKVFPKLKEVITVNKTLELARIAIHDNPKVCVPPEDIDRLRKSRSGRTLLDDTYIQKCQCDMNVLKEMAKKIVKEKKPLRSVGRCVVLNGDLTIDGHVEDYLKYALGKLKFIYGVISIINSSWKNFRLPILEVIENRSKRPAIVIKDNAHLENVDMPMLSSLKSFGDHVSISNNPKLQLSQLVKERFQIAILDDPTEHERSTIHIKTSSCQVSISGITPAIRHCTIAHGDIDITKQTITENTNLQYLSSIEKLNGCLTIKETSLKNLLFLRSLKEIHCEKNQHPILIEDNPITAIELTAHTVLSKFNQTVMVRNNIFLCPETIERWQQLLSAMAKANGKGSLLEHENNGVRCGIQYSEGLMLPAAMVMSSAMLFGAMVAINRRLAA